MPDSPKTIIMTRYRNLASALAGAAGKPREDLHEPQPMDQDYILELFHHIRNGGAVRLSDKTLDGRLVVVKNESTTQ